ncbi:MAG TPA: hypothetical protein VGI45_10395 [Terracidiphilus sp.]|jgi:hypothetical protein
MDVTCPSCRSRIAPNDINVSTDVALCRSCGNTFRLSEIIGAIPSSSIDLHSPPSGAWYTPMADGFIAGATTRTWMALFLVPFTCVWAGGSMFGIYGTQIMTGKYSASSSLFGIPFLIGSIFLVSWCLMNVAGKVTVTRHSDQLSIFTGVGSIGWTRTCQLSDFSTVREGYGSFSGWNRQGPAIRLEGKRAVAFGSMLSTDRRYFLLKVIQSALREARSSSIFAR